MSRSWPNRRDPPREFSLSRPTAVGRGADAPSRATTVRRLLPWLIAACCVASSQPAASAAPNRPPTFELPSGPEDVWEPRETDREWTCVAGSADGRQLLAGVREGRLHHSTDFGATWTPREEIRRWRAAASSADGRRLVAAVEAGRIHLSDDAGSRWHAREGIRNWSSVATSVDGRILAATVADGFIHVSTDAGATWTPRASEADWRGVACSADGRRLAAVVRLGRVHVSSDAGVNWTRCGVTGHWSAIASSADGGFLAAAETNGLVHVSRDGGASWRVTDSNPGRRSWQTRVWRAIACSADAAVLAGVDSIIPDPPGDRLWSGYVLASPDQGGTWDWISRQRDWSAIACSADGRRLVAAARGGRLYTLERTTSRYTLFTLTQSGPVSIPGFATRIASGPRGEPAQQVRFEVTADSPALFAAPPALLSDGTLTLATTHRHGSTTVTVVARDDGGTSGGGSDTSDPKTFTIRVQGRSFRADPWNGDVNSGLSREATLWAWRLGRDLPEQAVIHGVPVPWLPAPDYREPGQIAVLGEFLDGGYSEGAPSGIEGPGSALIAKTFLGHAQPAILRLERLIPGRPYTLLVYGIGMPASGELRCTWSGNGESVDLDERAFGIHRGIRVSHEFTPSREQYEVVVTPRGVTPWAFFAVALNAVPARAAIEQPAGSPRARGGAFEFGAYPPGLHARRTFTLRNEGVVPLKDLVLAVDGPNADEFTLAAPPGDTIPGEGLGTFSLEFRPSGPGPRSARLRVASNDPEPFTLHLHGTGQSEAEVPARDLPAHTMDEDRGSLTLPIEVGEPASDREFTLTATAGDPDLVPPAHLIVEGTGPERRVTVTPAPDRFGTTVLHVLASDGSRSRCWRIPLHVRPVNDPPRFALPPGVVTPAGTHWAARDTARPWRAIASSHDGRHLAAAVHGGRIFTSIDAGETWTPRASDRSWTALACSADGIRLAGAVADGPLFTSADAGITWQERATPRAWSGVASSADGRRLAATVDGGLIYTSTDSGATWTPRDQARFWHGIASSADGRTLAAIVEEGLVHVSTDAGTNWTARAEPHRWTALAMSADGAVLAASTWDGPVFFSRDGGVEWTASGPDRFRRSISCSADGSRVVAVETLGRVHRSSDFGRTWTEHDVERDWAAVSCSGDGRRIAAAVLGGPILMSAESTAPHRLTVSAVAEPTRVRGFVTGLSSGPTNEVGQRLTWTVTSPEAALFTVPPSVDDQGSLGFVPAGRAGLARVTLTARDDGGTERGGSDTAAPQTFEIELR